MSLNFLRRDNNDDDDSIAERKRERGEEKKKVFISATKQTYQPHKKIFKTFLIRLLIWKMLENKLREKYIVTLMCLAILFFRVFNIVLIIFYFFVQFSLQLQSHIFQFLQLTFFQRARNF